MAGASHAGRGARTRGQLVEVALALFAERGVEATSVDEITAAAAVAKGTFYVHFQRKQDVLLERAAQLVDGVSTARLPRDAAAALGALGGRLATSMAATTPREVVGRMVREIVGNREAWLRVLGPRRTLGDLIRPLVERGQAAGTLRTDLSPARLTQGLVILWLDTVLGWAERPVARDLAAELASATTLFLDGARGRKTS